MNEFRNMVRELRRKFPPLLPVRVYRRPVKGDYLGYTEMVLDERGKPHHFIIVVGKMGWHATWQVLFHEWAHAVSWRDGHEEVCDHDPEWALALSRIYQEMKEP